MLLFFFGVSKGGLCLEALLVLLVSHAVLLLMPCMWILGALQFWQQLARKQKLAKPGADGDVLFRDTLLVVM